MRFSDSWMDVWDRYIVEQIQPFPDISPYQIVRLFRCPTTRLVNTKWWQTPGKRWLQRRAYNLWWGLYRTLVRISNSLLSFAITNDLAFPSLVKAIPRYSNFSPTLNARRGVRLIKKVVWSVQGRRKVVVVPPQKISFGPPLLCFRNNYTEFFNKKFPLKQYN